MLRSMDRLYSEASVKLCVIQRGLYAIQPTLTDFNEVDKITETPVNMCVLKNKMRGSDAPSSFVLRFLKWEETLGQPQNILCKTGS